MRKKSEECALNNSKNIIGICLLVLIIPAAISGNKIVYSSILGVSTITSLLLYKKKMSTRMFNVLISLWGIATVIYIIRYIWYLN